ncbi:MAG TPA: flagellar basal body rod C-terminal domain-containing protein [Bryobacteraceae bacterium]|nr:flagellar basal body rod C-terminal domain-containing protein [Bryobacteraceae bacterium]
MLGLLPALDGLLHSSAQFDQAASRIARAPVGPADAVDLSAAAVALIQSKNNFEANSKVIQAIDEMQHVLIDTLG